MELSERKALRAYASMVNTSRVEELEQYLAEDFVYESQAVLTPLKSKSEFLSYMRPKLETIRKSGATAYAEMGEIHAYGALRPCVILAQHSKDNLIGIVLAEIRNDKISRIDLCIVPPPEQAKRSGEYPGRKADTRIENMSKTPFQGRIEGIIRQAIRDHEDLKKSSTKAAEDAAAEILKIVALHAQEIEETEEFNSFMKNLLFKIESGEYFEEEEKYLRGELEEEEDDEDQIK